MNNQTTTTVCTRRNRHLHAARARLNGSIIRTPCPESSAAQRIDRRADFLQTGVFAGRTHGSFKERGARNALAQLSSEQVKQGVIAASAGTHALGLSWHGRSLGVPVTVVMPRFAPLVKVVRCRQFGATVILHGDTFDEARQEAAIVWRRNGNSLLFPPLTIPK